MEHFQWKMENGKRKFIKPNYTLSIIHYSLVIALCVFMFSCTPKENHTHEADVYTCPMHPTVLSDKPGSCPVCGMDLVRKGKPGEEVKITEELAKLIQSPNEVIVASVPTLKGEFKSKSVARIFSGIATYDSRYVFTIPARIEGRLEKVNLKYAYQPVYRGQKVAEIYSPNMVTAQRELLFVAEHDAENTALIESAKNKLLLLGATERQIDEVLKVHEPLYRFDLYSPFDGFLILGNEKQTTVLPSSSTPATSGMDAMKGSASSAPVSNEGAPAQNPVSLPREGSYVTAGQILFTLVNAQSLRIEFNIPQAEVAGIKIGEELEIQLDEKTSTLATIDFIQPFFGEGQEFLKIRTYLKNKTNLSIGQLVTARVTHPINDELWIPREAIIDLGTDQVVLVKDRGVFKPRKISTGVQSGNWIEIKGLSSSEEIAANAQYLVDSESFIKTRN